MPRSEEKKPPHPACFPGVGFLWWVSLLPPLFFLLFSFSWPASFVGQPKKEKRRKKKGGSVGVCGSCGVCGFFSFGLVRAWSWGRLRWASGGSGLGAGGPRGALAWVLVAVWLPFAPRCVVSCRLPLSRLPPKRAPTSSEGRERGFKAMRLGGRLCGGVGGV